MALSFKGSPKPTLGVEIELQVLDPITLDLKPQGGELIALCQSYGIERVKAEIHQSMIEIDTEIAQDVKQSKTFLAKRIDQLLQVANRLGVQLAVAGTHPFQRWPERLVSHHERYQNLHEKFQWLVRRMNVYGLHVHVGLASGDLALKLSNALIRFQPHLLALSANSPFWQGVDTGMQSSRMNIMESFPFAGLPPLLDSWSEFEHYYATLHGVKVIQSIKDLYWHIRPNPEFGTLEFRICDAMANLSHTMSIVALIQSLVVWMSEQIQEDPNKWRWTQEAHWIAAENQWIAARDGLDGILIKDLHGKRAPISEGIVEMIEQLSMTAQQLNCFEELQGLAQILKNGNGASQQRKIYKETGSLKDVVAASLKELKAAGKAV